MRRQDRLRWCEQEIPGQQPAYMWLVPLISLSFYFPMLFFSSNHPILSFFPLLVPPLNTQNILVQSPNALPLHPIRSPPLSQSVRWFGEHLGLIGSWGVCHPKAMGLRLSWGSPGSCRGQGLFPWVAYRGLSPLCVSVLLHVWGMSC